MSETNQKCPTDNATGEAALVDAANDVNREPKHPGIPAPSASKSGWRPFEQQHDQSVQRQVQDWGT